MSDQVRFELTRSDSDPTRWTFALEVLDSDLHGEDATLRMILHSVVHDDRPEHAERELWSAPWTVAAGVATFDITLDELVYSYDGTYASVEVRSHLQVHDGFVWDTKVEGEHALPFGLSTLERPTDTEAIDPADLFDIATTVALMPEVGRKLRKARIIAVAVSVGAVLLGGAGTLVIGLFAFIPVLVIVLVTWSMVMLHRQAQLETWSELEGSPRCPARITPSTTVAVQDLFAGVCHADISGVRLRVVGCNMERGQYIRGSGSDRKTVSFQQPARTVVLYDQVAPRIRAGDRLEEAWQGDISFLPFFSTVLPPIPVAAEHGLASHLEVQLLHDDVVDKELILPAEIADFDSTWRPRDP